jgi:hypothetical protein
VTVLVTVAFWVLVVVSVVALIRYPPPPSPSPRRVGDDVALSRRARRLVVATW